MNYIILIFIVIVCLMIYSKYRKQEHIQNDTKIKQTEHFITQKEMNKIKLDRARINNFNDSFFNFNNRINNLSMYDDPVDKINRERAGCNWNVGLDIKEIYDNLSTPIV